MWPTLITSLLPNLLDKLFPDPEKANEAKLKLLELQQSGQLAELKATTDLALEQIKVNAKEAESPSLLVSGWRPSVGWVCVAGLAYEFLARPIAIGFGHQFPELPMDDLNTLLFGMLGLGALRTVEKVKGVA